MEAEARKVEQAVQNALESISKTDIVPLAKAGYLCCARCCDKPYSPEDFKTCLLRCQAPAQAAEKIVQQSVTEFQGRLQRCASRCQDEAKESLPANPGEHSFDKAQKILEKCIGNCAMEYRGQVWLCWS
ncbi:hypothetical protein WJX73_009856 [Symbiochloris irregularis]|uniref:Protein FAM136A n=1 Tax=Symbiochloris irregularis TaxID=706552 RepID=A0AAW1PM13_9CHLO